MKVILIVACLGLAACGPGLAWDGDPSKCSFVEAGTCYQVSTNQPTATPEWVAKAREEAESVLGYGVLHGYLVKLKDVPGAGACRRGCNWIEEKRIEVWVSTPSHLGILIHEAGHEVYDKAHQDPGWDNLGAVEGKFEEDLRVLFNEVPATAPVGPGEIAPSR